MAARAPEEPFCAELSACKPTPNVYNGYVVPDRRTRQLEALLAALGRTPALHPETCMSFRSSSRSPATMSKPSPTRWPWSLAKALLPVALAGLLVAAWTASSPGDDWPQWRGPARDGEWNENGIVTEFAGDELPLKWKAPLGAGYCGPTVADGRVFVMDRLDDPEQIERIWCFNAENGDREWMFSYTCEYNNISYTAGPRASVSIDGDRAFALGAMGNFHCLNTATGGILWQHDLNSEYRIRMPIWGISASPLVYGDLVIAQIGGEGACLVAFNKTDGKEVWKALDDKASYSSPIIVQQGGQDVLACWTGEGIVGLNPTTGELHWRLPFKPKQMVINVATPIIDDGRMFLTSFYDGSIMVQLDQDHATAQDLWRRAGRNEMHTDALHSIISTPVFQGDYVYGVDSHGEFRCLNAANGDRVWSTNKPFQKDDETPIGRWGTIHFVQHGKQTWMLTERGDLIIAELSPEGYKELDRAHLIDPTTEQLRQRGGVVWSHPAFANRCVFARNDKELVCASLARE